MSNPITITPVADPNQQTAAPTNTPATEGLSPEAIRLIVSTISKELSAIMGGIAQPSTKNTAAQQQPVNNGQTDDAAEIEQYPNPQPGDLVKWVESQPMIHIGRMCNSAADLRAALDFPGKLTRFVTAYDADYNVVPISKDTSDDELYDVDKILGVKIFDADFSTQKCLNISVGIQERKAVRNKL